MLMQTKVTKLKTGYNYLDPGDPKIKPNPCHNRSFLHRKCGNNRSIENIIKNVQKFIISSARFFCKITAKSEIYAMV